MPETQDVVTDEQRQALDVAAQLIAAGVPVFAAPPCPAAHGGQCDRPGHGTGKQEYDLPAKWQLTVPSDVWLQRWRPGWALAAVGGHAADFLDVDPRNGGEASMSELEGAGQWPRVFGVQETPSGGWHYMISPLRERETNGFMSGIDYQGGAPDGGGRAFIWIAPTVRRSKAPDTAGEVRPYRWLQPPDTDYLSEFADGADDSGQAVRARILAAGSAAKKERVADERTVREFTEAEARAFCDITLQRLMQAPIGSIEEAANAAAAQLSHFVPDLWSAEFAHSVLMAALGETAYDPDHPASGWTADKFWPVLRGENGRAPDDWKAVRKPEPAQHVADVEVEPDAVDALLAEMLKPSEVIARPRPRYLIQGLLNLDSESWLIGEPGSKKSFVALDMAGRVANGRHWQGMPTRPGGVVIIAAEGAGGLGNRLAAWEKINGPMGDRVDILPRPVQSAALAAWAVLVEACRRLRPALVVIDTQARVTVGLEENSATDMGVYVEAVRAIREATGACVLSVHHTGRKGGDARGSSAIDGAQFTELKVVVDAGGNRLRGLLKIEKQKDMEMGPDIPLMFERVDLGLDEDGQPLSSLVLNPDPDAWALAAEQAPEGVDAGQVESVQEPQEWTHRLFGHPKQETKRRILQVLADAGGEVGIAEAKCGRLVRERWHGGRPFGRGPGQLKETNFTDNWTALLAHILPSGEPLIINPSGEKRAVNPDVLRDVTD